MTQHDYNSIQPSAGSLKGAYDNPICLFTETAPHPFAIERNQGLTDNGKTGDPSFIEKVREFLRPADEWALKTFPGLRRPAHACTPRTMVNRDTHECIPVPRMPRMPKVSF